MQALEQVGFSKEAGIPSPSDCFFGIDKLASKAQIAQARTEIQAMLTKGLSQTTPQLDTRNNGQRQTLK